MTHAVVTGGGTSGHVLPALAIMDRLVAAGHERADLHYVGTQRGIEARLLPPTGYGHTLLDVVGPAAIAHPAQPCRRAQAGAKHPRRRPSAARTARPVGRRERRRVRQHAGHPGRAAARDPRTWS
jgi:hypothetical protein